ncbi:AGC family protein kinase [Tritrichomonas foetus]|uniref:AGC family protein kinase n=1 Tax=Tritrichomonas foetus TaxID=1144522 RepID=A0A1J4L3V8_9EUKA|nr:AGC family protein kinase [Tritrichomonas foetus]|eukprot:OHT16605.1 AGC family protein kinase [Tritrichomonas foetus]
MMRWILAIRGCTYNNPKISIDQFKIISVIGRGFYGKVMLVQHTKTGETLAIKSIQKWKLVQSKKIHTVLIERNILESIHFPFIVSLRYAFQTDKKFYLVLEYVPGGELFFHMQKLGALPLDVVKLYIAEISLALNHLHSHGIVYRDLKPENVLIDADGHIKLTDFGLSKLTEETSTFCGTSEYLAPEIISRQPYSYQIDWWSLGVLMYEMLFERTPWVTQNRAKLFDMIQKDEPEFPEDANKEAVEFLKFILVKDPRKRPGFHEIRRHSFFRDFDFEKVLNMEYQSNFVPHISNELKPTNFDAEFIAEVAGDSSAASTAEHEDDYLPGFSYTGEQVIENLHFDESIIANKEDVSDDYMKSDSDSSAFTNSIEQQIFNNNSNT